MLNVEGSKVANVVELSAGMYLAHPDCSGWASVGCASGIGTSVSVGCDCSGCTDPTSTEFAGVLGVSPDSGVLRRSRRSWLKYLSLVN